MIDNLFTLSALTLLGLTSLMSPNVSTDTVVHANNNADAARSTLQITSLAVGQSLPCSTLTNDPNPPLNVRSNSSSKSPITSMIANGVVINVTQNRDGWLEIDSPHRGWVSMKLTKVSCGSLAIKETDANIRRLGNAAIQGDRSAVDTLVRYLFSGADGGPSEIASSILGQLAEKNPRILIAVLDKQLEEVRYQVLHDSYKLGDLAGKSQSQFEAELARQDENSATARTWERIVREK